MANIETLSCIIVDDEANNLQLIKALLGKYFPALHIIAAIENPQEAIELINKQKPHLIYLDIEMPQMTGFELLKMVNYESSEVIFITAYNQYALEAFDAHAVGYITKPVNIEKFKTATQKAIEKKQSAVTPLNLQQIQSLLVAVKQETMQIALPTAQGILFVKPDEIVHLESNGNYTKFYFTNRKDILISRQLGEYEKSLPTDNFIRVHDKYIINLTHITEYKKGAGGTVITALKNEIPVSVRKKDDFVSRFDRWLKK